MNLVITALYWFGVFITAILLLDNIRFLLKGVPHRRLKFIEKAAKNQCYKMGKRCCSMIVRDNAIQDEYIYLVDDKTYYVTYEHTIPEIEDWNRLENYNAEHLLLRDYNLIKIFYDPKHPQKCMIKDEVFLSNNFLHKVKTPKHNRFRSVSIDWSQELPIDLRMGG